MKGLLLLLAIGAAPLPAAAQAAGSDETALSTALGEAADALSRVRMIAPPNGAALPSSAAGLGIGRCALGAADRCLEALRCGLRPQDRAAVTLGPAGELRVDPAHSSPSANFAALRQTSLAAPATVLVVLDPGDILSLRTSSHWPSDSPDPTTTPMGHPDTANGFLGYTFFPFLGRIEDGIIYSPGPYTQVAVNAGQPPAGIAESFYHELRHVIKGQFGLAATKGKHGAPGVNASTDEAERETRANAARCP